MTAAPLEYRILTALLLGRSTNAELSLMLDNDMPHVQKRMQWLRKRRMVKENGWGKAIGIYRGNPGFKYELTKAGRQWAEEIIQ